MCSIVDATPAPVTVPGFLRLVAHAREAAAAVRAAAGDSRASFSRNRAVDG